MTTYREVWLLHSEGWSLPLLIKWSDSMGRIELPDIPLTKLMLEAINKRISELAINNDEHWFIPRVILECNADPMPYGTDPETLVHWTMPLGRRTRVQQPAGMEGFFEDWVAAGYGKVKTVGEAQLIWGTLIGHMLNRLAVQRLPVHLGFAILQPLPFRPDWTAIMLRRFWSVMNGYKSKGVMVQPLSSKEAYRAAAKKIPEWLTDDRMLMINRQDKRAHWTIHVKHTKGWWKAMMGVEIDRRKRRPGLSYFLDIRKEVEQKAQIAYEIFRDQASQARKPQIRIPKGTRYLSAKETRLRIPVKFKSVGISNSVRAVFDDRTAERIYPATQQTPGLQIVRYLRSTGKGLRKEIRALEQPDDGQAGT